MKHLCIRCSEVYSGRVSCPECGLIPRRHRLDYEPPEPVDPFRVQIDTEKGSMDMTVRHEGQRRLAHWFLRLFGGGPRNDGERA